MVNVLWVKHKITCWSTCALKQSNIQVKLFMIFNRFNYNRIQTEPQSKHINAVYMVSSEQWAIVLVQLSHVMPFSSSPYFEFMFHSFLCNITFNFKLLCLFFIFVLILFYSVFFSRLFHHFCVAFLQNLVTS